MSNYVREGFPGQRLRVLPQPVTRAALTQPVTQRLLVTDVGFFPHASRHGRSRPHGAPEAIVIICVGGAGWLRLEHQPERRVASGSAIVLPANVAHLYRADAHDPWTIWWLHVAGTETAELIPLILGKDRDPVVEPHDVYSAVASVEDALSALEQDETTPTLYRASGAAWRLLANLASDRLRGRPQTTDRIGSVQQYLRDNLEKNFSVSDLARLAGVSTSHFSALFRSSAGISVVEYIKRLRSARARELLITTDHTIAEIAAAVGYPDAFYFSRQFRAINSMSPTEFRRRAARHALAPHE